MNVFRDGVIAFFLRRGDDHGGMAAGGAVLHAGRPTIPGFCWYCLCGVRR